jgi:hypothetical protein
MLVLTGSQEACRLGLTHRPDLLNQEYQSADMIILKAIGLLFR